MYPWFGAIDVVMGSNERIAVDHASTPDGRQDYYRRGWLSDTFEEDDEHAWHFWSMHPNGSNFLFADGSVRFLGYSISRPPIPNPPPGHDLLRDMATRKGGEVVASDW
jgi:prepilin-type processing-associated H-X9-DG protein